MNGLRYPFGMLVFAHRGIRGRLQTENTLGAFQAAVDLGADGVEFDLRLSKEGELVVVHDVNLSRIAGDARRVVELTAEELASVALRNGGSIMTLNAVTASIHAPTQLDIEIKHRDAVEPLIRKLATSAGLRERVVVSSFLAGALQRVKKAHPDVRTLLLIPRWPLPLRGTQLWRRIHRLSPTGVALPIRILNARRVHFLRQFGLVGGWDLQLTLAEAHKAKKLGLDIGILHHVSAAIG